MKTIAFFNNKGGVGKTSLVYHLAWMYAELDIKVIAADFDPQANLTSMFLPDDRLEELWPDDDHPLTIRGIIDPILRGTGDIKNELHVESIADNLGLICGDLGLSMFEDDLSAAWPLCNDGKEAAFRIISSFYRIMYKASITNNSELVLIDIGPNLGAINRAALISADYVVIPLTPDLFSIQGLKNLGPTLIKWRNDWKERLKKRPNDLILPAAEMKSIGYVVLQHSVRLDRPTKSYDQWVEKIPQIYRTFVLDLKFLRKTPSKNDKHRLSFLKHYRSLMPMAMEARKPIFKLTPADGSIGSHMQSVKDCYWDFNELARKIAERAGIEIPPLV